MRYIDDVITFITRYESGTAPLPMEEDAVAMLVSAANKFVAAGYEHYEVCSLSEEAVDLGLLIVPVPENGQKWSPRIDNGKKRVRSNWKTVKRTLPE